MYKEENPFQIICVTDRKSCKGDFLRQIEAVAAAGVDSIIYRDKEITVGDYDREARKIKRICRRYDVCFIRHTHVSETPTESVHLPERILADFLMEECRKTFERNLLKVSKRREITELPKQFGVSVHNVENAVAAECAGASYITAGHIFSTSCKPGLEPRGEAFLRQVAASVDIPVYGIGGITSENIARIKKCGATGACLMSSFMESSNPSKLMDEISTIIMD